LNKVEKYCLTAYFVRPVILSLPLHPFGTRSLRKHAAVVLVALPDRTAAFQHAEDSSSGGDGNGDIVGSGGIGEDIAPATTTTPTAAATATATAKTPTPTADATPVSPANAANMSKQQLKKLRQQQSRQNLLEQPPQQQSAPSSSTETATSSSLPLPLTSGHHVHAAWVWLLEWTVSHMLGRDWQTPAEILPNGVASIRPASWRRTIGARHGAAHFNAPLLSSASSSASSSSASSSSSSASSLSSSSSAPATLDTSSAATSSTATSAASAGIAAYLGAAVQRTVAEFAPQLDLLGTFTG
jgi:hypothetical protein